jgi:hypothetical protein
MITEISELTTRPSAYDGKDVTVAGAVRATYHTPFPHFILEDNSGTVICRPANTLPSPGGHVEISGHFLIGIPENCELSVHS